MKRFLVATIAAGVLLPAAASAQSIVVTESPQDTIRQVQVQLAARGFSPGPADGQLTDQTRDAVRQLQRSRALTPSGLLDANTLGALGIQPRGPVSQVLPNGTPPPGMIGPGSTAPTGRSEGPSPANTLPPGGVPQTLPLGASTPAGAPPPSFGATPAGAPAPSFGATPAGLAPPAFNPANVGATVSPLGTSTTVTTAPAAATIASPATTVTATPATTIATVPSTTVATTPMTPATPLGTAATTTAGAAAARSSGR